MENVKFKDIKIFKLKENIKVIFPHVESWHIDVGFQGKENPDWVIGEVEDYYIKDDYILADIIIYENPSEDIDFEIMTVFAEQLYPTIAYEIISENQIKLITLSLCPNPNEDCDIKNLAEQRWYNNQG
jgi:hypothetical protein